MEKNEVIKNIIGLKAGSHSAFEYLFREYNLRVYGFAYKFLHNHAEAENIVQSVFVKLWENRAILNENLSLKAYLFKITKNMILNLVKKQTSRDLFLNYISDNGEQHYDIDKELNYNELFSIVEQSIQSLPERRKQIFILSRYEGLSYKKIARKLDISENTVDTQIRHALKFLREEITKHYKEFSFLAFFCFSLLLKKKTKLASRNFPF